jgi:long-subunit fatty acid transport protein
MRRTKTSLGILLIGLGVIMPILPGLLPSSWAQGIEITSSPNPVGSGARALGMGGAFIAVADDATAASWNPAGLVQLERPEVSVVGEAVTRSEDGFSRNHPETSANQSVSRAGLNYLSATYPFAVWGCNMVVSLNYQHLYDFSRQWQLNIKGKGLKLDFDYDASGGLYAYGLAYSLQIMPELAFGFTLNLWQDGIYQNGWDSVGRGKARINNYFNITTVQKDSYSFSGFNANVGLLWNVTDKLTLGGVVKTPFSGDLTHQFTFAEKMLSPAAGFSSASVATRTTDEQLKMPMSYGMGVAYRFSDRFSVSADLFRTQWQNFILVNAEGKERSPINNKNPKRAEIDPTTQVRLGSEYLFIQPQYTVPVRAGLFYDPGPAPDSPDDYYGFSLGTGIGIGRFIFDVAYVYRYGRNVGDSLLSGFDFSQDVREHNLYMSLIVHF